LRVLFVSSEIFPLAKTGGLADVSAGLPMALAALGIEMQLLMPGYPRAIEAATAKSVALAIDDFMDAGPLRLVSARMPDTGLPVWLVDCPALFERSGGLYQDEQGADWPDNARRFAVFNHVAAQLSLGLLLPTWRPDLVHCNDWHTGLLPLLLGADRRDRPATVFTLHNLAYQGVFPGDLYPQLGLPGEAFNTNGLEFYGKISFIKAGIVYGDRLTTVSPSYAREMLTAEYGFGLDGLLRERSQDLSGILNGADYRIWNPSDDRHLPAVFSAQAIAGKRVCKSELQQELGLEADPAVPLVAYLSRITDQKMADTIADALPAMLERGIQFALLGEGDRAIEERLKAAARNDPRRVAVRISYQEPLAHRLQAGADLLVHAARFEPCGLTQLYAMRYGTLPIVRWTGGLRDTVIDATEQTIHAGTATGFAFQEATVADMVACLDRALLLYRQPLAWRKVQRTAMAQDFGWERSARDYIELYRSLAPQADVIADPPELSDRLLEKAVG
jgi:starch synthase